MSSYENKSLSKVKNIFDQDEKISVNVPTIDSSCYSEKRYNGYLMESVGKNLAEILFESNEKLNNLIYSCYENEKEKIFHLRKFIEVDNVFKLAKKINLSSNLEILSKIINFKYEF